jgi:hypothetical protein
MESSVIDEDLRLVVREGKVTGGAGFITKRI